MVKGEVEWEDDQMGRGGGSDTGWIKVSDGSEAPNDPSEFQHR